MGSRLTGTRISCLFFYFFTFYIDHFIGLLICFMAAMTLVLFLRSFYLTERLFFPKIIKDHKNAQYAERGILK